MTASTKFDRNLNLEIEVAVPTNCVQGDSHGAGASDASSDASSRMPAARLSFSSARLPTAEFCRRDIPSGAAWGEGNAACDQADLGAEDSMGK